MPEYEFMDTEFNFCQQLVIAEHLFMLILKILLLAKINQQRYSHRIKNYLEVYPVKKFP